MFTWICPQCGSEVPPSYSECPNCAGKQQPPAEASAAAPPAQPPPPAAPAARHLPGWLVSVVVAGVLIAVGGIAYYFTRSGPAPSASTGLGQPAATTPADTRPHPLTRQIEVTGIRITEDASQKAQVQFVLVNHSGADIADLGGTISLKPVGAKPEQAPLVTFEFKVPSLGPYESKELKTTVHSSVRAYELPDWQFLRTDFRITSPPPPQ